MPEYSYIKENLPETFSIKISPSSSAYESIPNNKKQEFWGYIKKRIGEKRFSKQPTHEAIEVATKSDDELELRLIRLFGFHLKHHLLDELNEGKDSNIQANFFFVVSRIRYSSLELGVAIGGIEKLAKFFDFDINNFSVFLEAYVPLAFTEIFDQQLIGALNFDINLQTTLAQNFSDAKQNLTASIQPVIPASPAGIKDKIGKIDQAKFIWGIANFSLVIPVLLALLVLYLAWDELTKTRDAHEKELKPLIEHQMRMIEEDRQRFNMLLDKSNKDTSSAMAKSSPTPTATPKE